jgi:hypothetical protein
MGMDAVSATASSSEVLQVQDNSSSVHDSNARHRTQLRLQAVHGTRIFAGVKHSAL